MTAFEEVINVTSGSSSANGATLYTVPAGRYALVTPRAGSVIAGGSRAAIRVNGPNGGIVAISGQGGSGDFMSSQILLDEGETLYLEIDAAPGHGSFTALEFNKP